jgi:hypothetical protein
VKNVKFISMLVAMLALLAIPATGLAQDPTVQGYGGVAGAAQGDIEPAGAAAGPGEQVTPAPQAAPAAQAAAPAERVQTRAAEGGLPFTGLDLAMVIAAGMGLMLVGVGMRRLTARNAAV